LGLAIRDARHLRISEGQTSDKSNSPTRGIHLEMGPNFSYGRANNQLNSDVDVPTPKLKRIRDKRRSNSYKHKVHILSLIR
jgi:hypothetical protein